MPQQLFQCTDLLPINFVDRGNSYCVAPLFCSALVMARGVGAHVSGRIELDDVYVERKCNSSADGKPSFIAAVETAPVVTSARIKLQQVPGFRRDTLKVLARYGLATKTPFVRSTFDAFMGIEVQAAHISRSSPDLRISPRDYWPPTYSTRFSNTIITPWSEDLLPRSAKEPAARHRRLRMAPQLPIRYGHRHSTRKIRSGPYSRQYYMSWSN